MKLAEFFERNETSVEQFAARIGVTPNAVKYWISGDRTPRKEQMEKIVEATDGNVKPNDFFLSEAAE